MHEDIRVLIREIEEKQDVVAVYGLIDKLKELGEFQRQFVVENELMTIYVEAKAIEDGENEVMFPEWTRALKRICDTCRVLAVPRDKVIATIERNREAMDHRSAEGRRLTGGYGDGVGEGSLGEAMAQMGGPPGGDPATAYHRGVRRRTAFGGAAVLDRRLLSDALRLPIEEETLTRVPGIESGNTITRLIRVVEDYLIEVGKTTLTLGTLGDYLSGMRDDATPGSENRMLIETFQQELMALTDERREEELDRFNQLLQACRQMQLNRSVAG